MNAKATKIMFEVTEDSPLVISYHTKPPGLRFTFPTEERHRPSAGTKLYCLVTEAHACKQLAQGCYLEVDRQRFEPATFWVASERSTVTPHMPLNLHGV